MTMIGGSNDPQPTAAERYIAAQHALQGARFELTRFKDRVAEVIVEAVENGEVSKHYGNQMLDALGLDRMPTTWRASVDVRINVILESNEDEDGVAQELESLEVAVTTAAFGSGGSIEMESFEVTHVDDIEEDE